MGVMKRSLILILGLTLFTVMPTMAAVTVEETTDAEYLMNSGYSQLTAEDVFVQKNRATGKPIETLYDTSSNKLVNLWKRFYAYLDPGIDSVDRVHHDIKPSPSFTDL